ncbi:MAG: hypothetical protein J5755_04455 [Clostridia bacterium]|nr:hypothetical protein [Clostridia bacterium]
MSAGRKALKGIGITLLVLLAIVVFAVLCLFALRGAANIERVSYDGTNPTGNPYIVNSTMISAHRAGRKLAPENTLAAFSRCFALMEEQHYTIDTLEFDLQMTSDGELVLLHDDTLDRTSNCRDLEGWGKKSKVKDHTLAELKTLEMWHDYDGNDFLESEARICTLQEVFDYVIDTKGYTDMTYIIEIKDDGKLGEQAMDKLYEIMAHYGVVNQVVVGTFNDNVTKYIDKEYASKGVIRSASIKEVLAFYFSFCFKLDVSKQNLGYRVLQIPSDQYVVFDLGKKAIIDYAHHYGIALQYWTINEEKEMKRLMENGADMIMSDYPDRVNKVALELAAS